VAPLPTSQPWRVQDSGVSKAVYYITRTGQLHQDGPRSGDRYLGTVTHVQRDRYSISIFYRSRVGKPRYVIMGHQRFLRDERTTKQDLP
jgi:hypothetical protein